MKKDIKTQRNTMDPMKYNLIPRLVEKKFVREMFKDLVDLFNNDNMNKKIILRNMISFI